MPDLSLLDWILIEIAILAIALLACMWDGWQAVAACIERLTKRIATRPIYCLCLIVVTSLLIRLALLPIEHVPKPLYHDEFSYLLGADTFAHGRITNTQPPVPIAFETIHENLWPTYQSMYMPGTFFLLALGQLLGTPWIGVLISTAVFCAAVYWMASAWLSPGCALVLAIIAIAVTGSMNWWFDNYFCLAFLSLGGALVLGSLPRIEATLRWKSTWTFGAGSVIFMLIRPYEGCCIVIPCALGLLWSLRHIGPKKIASLVALPTAMLGLAAAWLLFYNWRGTGHPLLFPYMVNFQQYHLTGPFIFSDKRAGPSYDIDIMRRFYIFAEVPQYEFMRNHPVAFLAKKILVYYQAVLFGFGLPLILGVFSLVRHRQGRLWSLPLFGFVGFAINVVLMGWSPFPQYVAPAFPLLLLLVGFGLVYIRGLRFAIISGHGIARGLVLPELMLFLSIFGYRIYDGRDFPEPQYVSKDRAHVAALMMSHPGKQLCLVRYTPFHESWQEWVFNDADPESSRLVWARSLDAETDRKVIAAFHNRQVWLAKPDFANDLLEPYTPEAPFPSAGSDVARR